MSLCSNPQCTVAFHVLSDKSSFRDFMDAYRLPLTGITVALVISFVAPVSMYVGHHAPLPVLLVHGLWWAL